jgi:hypothetical protein
LRDASQWTWCSPTAVRLLSSDGCLTSLIVRRSAPVRRDA